MTACRNIFIVCCPHAPPHSTTAPLEQQYAPNVFLRRNYMTIALEYILHITYPSVRRDNHMQHCIAHVATTTHGTDSNPTTPDVPRHESRRWYCSICLSETQSQSQTAPLSSPSRWQMGLSVHQSSGPGTWHRSKMVNKFTNRKQLVVGIPRKGHLPTVGNTEATESPL